ncbi:hypothetical protein M9458_053684, partial [Cirrhinus mrigala]
ACDLTLDTNTTHKHVKLSEENRKMTRVDEDQRYPDHPDRFDVYPQVLSVESLTGRCYWETEWSGKDGVYISVSYKDIKRKGRSHDCEFGWNEKSWSLIYYFHRLTARHSDKSIVISDCSGSSDRVGVYVDVSAGILSFYSISDTYKLTHLHTFTHTFTQPLHAGFYVNCNSSVSLASALSLNPSHLRELDLSYNHAGKSDTLKHLDKF